MKRCSKCKIEKKLSNYYTNKSQSGGYSYRCKECCKSDQKAIYLNNPEKSKERSINYKQRYSAKISEKRKANRFEIYLNESSRRYSISVDDLRILLKEKTCQICKSEIDFKSTNIHMKPNIDHCHKTGKVRGVICGYCNNLLGRAKDSTEILQNAINYLNK